MKRAIVVISLLTARAGMMCAQTTTLGEPHPQPAVAAIIRAFETYRLVGIGEVHRNDQVHALLVSLVRDPRFLAQGGDVVVEFGNARYQALVDRYIAGGAVPRDSLVHVWRDAVNILVWDAPVYERLLATVRAVNESRPPARRLRVVLADPPLDWTRIHDRAAWERVAASRDRHAADVIDREVLARGRRALLVFGSGHIENEKAYGGPGPGRTPNLAELLTAEHPGATLHVLADWTPEVDRRPASWRPPALVFLSGTSLGEVHVGPPADTPRLAELADALLYLGSSASLTTSRPAPEVYSDTTYLRELLRRNAIQGGANTRELQALSARYLGSRKP
jgi:hypothetical protein